MDDILDRADEAYEQMRDDGWMWGTPHTKDCTLEKYNKNLLVQKEYVQGKWRHKVYSYETLVATFEEGKPLRQLGYWSVTTQKHINYVAREFGIATIIKDGEKD